jgi:hypothetical protein
MIKSNSFSLFGGYEILKINLGSESPLLQLYLNSKTNFKNKDEIFEYVSHLLKGENYQKIDTALKKNADSYDYKSFFTINAYLSKGTIIYINKKTERDFFFDLISLGFLYSSKCFTSSLIFLDEAVIRKYSFDGNILEKIMRDPSITLPNFPMAISCFSEF